VASKRAGLIVKTEHPVLNGSVRNSSLDALIDSHSRDRILIDPPEFAGPMKLRPQDCGRKLCSQ